MEFDIYDFDLTLVPLDSGSLFIAYCTLHYPWIIITFPLMIIAALLMALGIIRFTQFKKICFIFLPLIPLQKAVCGFWNRHEKQLYQWFFERKRKGIVISASPDFLLEEISKRAGFDYLICSRHNKKNGKIICENSRGEEKDKSQFDENGTEDKINDVYSDSYKHDKYIFSLATGNCYHIENGERLKFNYKDKYGDK